MKKLLIVWCSTTGGTRQMAEAADVLGADALLLATPEHLGSMAGPMKDFLDRIYYPCLDRVNGRPWALLVCAGSDGTGTIRQAERIATGLRLKRVAEPVLVMTYAQTPEAILAPKTIDGEDLARCEQLGALLAAGLATGIFWPGLSRGRAAGAGACGWLPASRGCARARPRPSRSSVRAPCTRP